MWFFLLGLIGAGAAASAAGGGGGSSSAAASPEPTRNAGDVLSVVDIAEEPMDDEDENIFDDASETIREAMQRVHDKHSSEKKIAKTAFEIALQQLV